MSAVATTAHAQNIFDDNELRAQIINLSDQITTTKQEITHLATQLDKLTIEIRLLRELIDELRTTLITAAATVSQHTQEIARMDDKINNDFSASEQQAAAKTNRLRTILTGADAQTYETTLLNYIQTGDANAALKALTKIAQLRDLSAYAGPARYWIGTINHQQGNYETAKEALLKFLTDHPGDHREPDALYILAEIASILGEPDAAKWEDQIMLLYPASTAADRVRSLRP